MGCQLKSGCASAGCPEKRDIKVKDTGIKKGWIKNAMDAYAL